MSTDAHFHLVEPAKANAGLEEPFLKSCLTKWDLHGNMRLFRFRYDKAYHKMAYEEFVRDMLADPGFQAGFQIMSKEKTFVALASVGTAKEFRASLVPATLTTLDLFDRLQEADPPVVRANGGIIGCMEEKIRGFLIANKVQDMLVNEDSENYGLFTEAEQGEFLFRLFRHLVLGGSVNQYDDTMELYLESLKRLYKELLSVQRNAAGQIEVASFVYEVQSAQFESGASLFPFSQPNCFCYVAVDPLRRYCTVLYHAQKPFW